MRKWDLPLVCASQTSVVTASACCCQSNSHCSCNKWVQPPTCWCSQLSDGFETGTRDLHEPVFHIELERVAFSELCS